jgi:CheY-like chemotaxis protein
MTSQLKGLRVLIVEDEMLVADLLEDMLDTLGAVVSGVAARVPDALALVGDGAFDAAVLDVNVAGTPVTPVAEALAARGARFLFATGYGAAGVPAAFRDRAVLNKPYRAQDLEAALLNMLSG